MTTPFSVEITLSIEETARAHGWNSFVVNMFSNDQPEKMVDLLLAHRPDGIIYTAMGLRQVPVPEKLHKYRCVLANCESISGPFPTYIPDDEQGQYLGVKALLAAGYRRLLCIHLPKGIVATDRRRAGMERACREVGVDPDAMLHHYLPPGESTILMQRRLSAAISMARDRYLMLWFAGMTAWLLLSTRYCWAVGCAFRRTSLCWAMTIWWAPVSCFYRRCRRYSCRIMKLAVSVHCILSRNSITGILCESTAPGFPGRQYD